jgi:hypothetical protein
LCKTTSKINKSGPKKGTNTQPLAEKNNKAGSYTRFNLYLKILLMGDFNALMCQQRTVHVYDTCRAVVICCIQNYKREERRDEETNGDSRGLYYTKVREMNAAYKIP